MKFNDELNKLFEKREKLKASISSVSTQNITELSSLKSKLKDVENVIAEIDAEDNFNIIKKQIEHLVDDTDNLSCVKMWEVKKKLGSKKTEPPAAKKNEDGELVTNSSELKQLYERTYKKRLEHRKIKPELENMYKLKMNLFDLRIEVSKEIKSDNWTKENLSIVLKSLKRSKSAEVI